MTRTSTMSRGARLTVLLGAAVAVTGWLGGCEPRQVPRRSPLWVADSFRLEGRSREAAASFRRVRDSVAGTADTATLWRATLFLADAQMRIGQPDSAAVGFARALLLAGHDSSRVAWSLHLHSLLLHRLGEFSEAMTESRRAFAIGDLLRDYKLQAAALGTQATIASLHGRYREALALNERQLATQRDHGGTEIQIASTFNEIALGYFHTGRFTDALRMDSTALAFYRRTRNPEGVSRVSVNASNVNIVLGRYDEARIELATADSAVALTGEKRGQGFVAVAFGELYEHLGDHERARGYFIRALSLNREARLPYSITTCLENLGAVSIESGQLGDAARYLSEALEIADARKYGRQRAMTRVQLSRLAIAQGTGSDALRWADQAVALADSLGDPEVQYEALAARGAALEVGLSADAAQTYLRAIDLLESWRGRLALGDLRLGVAEPRRAVYEGAIRTLIAQGRVEESFVVADRARARLLLDLMAHRDLSRVTESADEQLRQQLSVLSEEQRHAPEIDQSAIDQQIVALTTQIEAREMERSGRLLEPTPSAVRSISVAGVRDSLLHHTRGLLEYFWGDSAVYGWWVDAHGARAVRLGSSDSLAALAAFLRGAIEQPVEGVDWRPSAERAFRAFVTPLVSTLPEDVIVVADGRLSYLPLETFLPAGDSLPLGATRRLVYAPSSATMLALSGRATQTSWQRAALVVGDPSPAGGPRGHESADRGDSLAALPFAAEEARSIFHLFEKDGAELLVGRRATPRQWLAQQPGRYRFIHFATHARIDERAPEHTRLVLAGGDLDLADIRLLDLHAQLVTLSACETALGHLVGNEGVIGLPHAFLSAGADAAVVTLWRVTDRSAADFMRDFYDDVHKGVPELDALRRVRLARIQSAGAERHPSRWAPYIFIGTAR